MTNTRKIFFFDIDDTLTSELTGQIPPSAAEAIHHAQQEGHLMYINTGRPMRAVPEFVKKINFDGYICGCGSQICDRDGKELWGVPLRGHADAVELTEAARSCGGDLVLEGPGELAAGLYAQPTTSGFLFDAERYKTQNIYMADPLAEGYQFIKFVVFVNHAEDIQAFQAVSDAKYTCIDRGPYMGSHLYEFMTRGCSKASGILQVCKLHGIDPSDTYAFGDSANDVAMFTAAGTCIAMGNCNSDELRSLATWVTDKASEDGLAHAIYRILKGQNSP